MKFLMIVLAIRTVVGLISNKQNEATANKADAGKGKTLHPAEFMLR
jgi:hypothetical protein